MALQYRLAPAYFDTQATGAYKVRLADDARACVVYLGVRQPSGFHPLGTGFLITYGDPQTAYLVTAAHVARALADAFVIRFNDKSGKAFEQDIDAPAWERHHDKAVDIAVLEYTPPGEASCTYWPGNAFASEHKLITKDLGAGDLAYIVGVYRLLHGKNRNLPIVHTGHVALMPGDEQIPCRDWTTDDENAPPIMVNGYLIEVSTLPGISGAPVFVRRSLDLAIGSYDPSGDQSHQDALKAWAHGTVWLLGVWQGAWMGDPSELLNELMLADIKGYSTPTVPINMGVCMPAVRLIEILDGDSLRKKRETRKQRKDAAHAVTPQSERRPVPFDEAVRRMLSTPPRPEVAKKPKK